MNVYILHHDLEPTERKINQLFEEKGVNSELVDIRGADVRKFHQGDLVLNRVYASVANRDYESIKRTLEILSTLEEKGVNCLNSHRTSVFDYNKFKSYELMNKNGIYTPRTLLVEGTKSLESVCDIAEKEFTFPMIVKRNTGGRGKDISKVESYEDLIIDLKEKFNPKNRGNYDGEFIIQEFISSSREHDCRVGIIDGEFAFSYARSLIPLRDGENPWLASTSNGSKECFYLAQEEEVKLALKASELIGARFNELDVTFTIKGPCIIENNPTPNYFVEGLEDLKRMERFVDNLIKKFGK
jgi:glutathione synthase/RimK-type ligase-like ATP-grasp enzyme